MSEGNSPGRLAVAMCSATTVAALLGFAPGAAGPASAQESRPPLELATFPRTSLQITHHEDHRAIRKYPFEVWVADTPERAQQGLMFVSDLPDSMGMVFPLPSPRVETMWMKNTYIELDMLFIRADGRVTKIIERAHPMSLGILSSDTPVSAVLELKGGAASKLGLRAGDTVTWKKPAQ
ncbi:MAG TPA: DUF192 domain-containing protein [Steroidobacteraceae bacterium]